jgi:hypothetical protein
MADVELSYRDWLNKLLGAGDRIPDALPKIGTGIAHLKAGVSDFNDAALIITGQTGNTKLGKMAEDFDLCLDDETTELESKVLSEIRSKDRKGNKLKAIGDGQLIARIREAWKFIQANPQLMQWVLNLLFKAPISSPIPQV